jgi:hypothetical protein
MDVPETAAYSQLTITPLGWLSLLSSLTGLG